MLNRAGAVVGLNFDSNIEKLPNRYFYVDDAVGSRAVAVYSVAIRGAAAALRRRPLADELQGEDRGRAGKPAPLSPAR